MSNHHQIPHTHAHDHALEISADSTRRVFWAMLLTGSFMLAEVAGGVLSGSLALLADAGHMLSDFVSLLLSWVAFRLSTRQADLRRTYGYHRFQVLAAFVNGLSLLAIATWICIEAVTRFFKPVDVLAGPMLIIAVLGLVINLMAFRILQRGHQDNLNLRSAMLHVLGDILGSVAAIAASLIILYGGWMQADPLLSILAALLIVKAGYSIVKQSGHILLQGAPEQVDPNTIREVITGHVPGAIDVHHIHIWSLTNEHLILTLHVRVADVPTSHGILISIHNVLKDHLGISHATVQIEDETCFDTLSQRPC
jgi:cobalt-zinc-cadmium efflux system protein